MRKQIAAANWKMNKTLQEGKLLLQEILKPEYNLQQNHDIIFAVPFPFLMEMQSDLESRNQFYISAQNCHHKVSGAYTGEVSVDMLSSIGIQYCIVGHSERREYFGETNAMLADKTNLCLKNAITPIFCCGEAPDIRESGQQNAFVELQLQESLFHLDAETIQRVVIAYEPIWAIGTGKTATSEQAQDMHAHLRSVFSKQYGNAIAENISILYGGSVKGANAIELFSQPDVDGGLVGGASLIPSEFIQIINALKK
jgi:triosephosphate isomerase